MTIGNAALTLNRSSLLRPPNRRIAVVRISSCFNSCEGYRSSTSTGLLLVFLPSRTRVRSTCVRRESEPDPAAAVRHFLLLPSSSSNSDEKTERGSLVFSRRPIASHSHPKRFCGSLRFQGEVVFLRLVPNSLKKIGI